MRPREFETEDALDRGMRVLWARGYEATSLEDLLEAMDLSKSSFYETFGSKHDFMIAALTRYIDVVLGQLAKDMREGSARDAIFRTFDCMIPTRGMPANGCFMQNCTIELAQHDPEARAKVREGLKRLEEGYYRAVLRGQENGEIGREQDARELARFLVSSLNGIVVLSRAGFDRKNLLRIAETTLGVLR